MSIRTRLSVRMALLLWIAVCSRAALGATCTFTGAEDHTNWNNPFNWSCGALIVPGPGDDVIIPTGETSVRVVDNSAANNLTIQSGAKVQIDPNQTLTVGGAMTVDGTVDIQGGTIGGAGAVTINSGGKVTSSGSAAINCTVNNNAGGAIEVTSGTLTLASGVTVGGSGSVTINSSGKVTSSGSAAINCIVNNNAGGTIEATAGTLTLGGGGTISGTQSISSGATIALTGGTFTIAGSPTASGGGTLSLAGAMVNIGDGPGGSSPDGWTSSTPITFTSGTIALKDGNLSTSSTFSVSATVEHYGGSLTGSGTMTINSGGVVRCHATDNHSNIAINTTVNSGGQIIYTNDIYNYTQYGIFNNVTITNNGTIDFQTDRSFDDLGLPGDTSKITNGTGTIKKSAGSGTITINVPVGSNSGSTIQADSGTLTFSKGGTFSSITIAGAGTVSLPAGHTLSGTTTLNGTLELTGNTAVGGSTLNVSGTLLLDNGVDVTWANVTLSGGTITGGGTVRVSALFNWSGGTITGTGPRVMKPTATPTISCVTACNLDGATLQLQASSTFSASTNALVFSNGANLTIDPGNILSFTNGGDFTNGGGAASSIVNNGRIEKQPGGGTSSIGVPVTLSAASEVKIDGGTLQFGAGASVAGGTILDIASGKTLEVTGGVFLINGPVTIQRNGDLVVSAGTLRVPTAVTVTLDNVTLQGSGVIDGGGALQVSGNFNWNGGTIAGGGARVLTGTSTPTISCSTGNCLLNGATLEFQTGPFYTASSNALVLSNGASLVLDPGQTLTVTNDGNIIDGGGAASSVVVGGTSGMFIGTIRKVTTSGTSTIGVPVTLSGAFNVDAGTLRFSAGVTVGANTIIDYDPGTAIEVTGGVFLFNSSSVFFPLNGDFKVSGGTLRLATGVTLTIPNVTLQGSGVIDGGGTLILSGTANWLGGTMGSAAAPGGITGINSGNGLNVTPVVPVSLTQARQLINNGTLAYGSIGSNILTMSGNSTITNNGALSFNDGTIALSGSALIENFGTIAKVAGTGTTLILPPFNNTSGGTMSAATGAIALSGGGSAAGAWSISSGATLTLGGGTFTVASTSTVTGAGALSINGGTVDVGSGVDATWSNVILLAGTITGAGTLRISGDLNWSGGTISGSGALMINSGGTMEIASTSVVPVIARNMTNNGTMTIPAANTVGVTVNGATIDNFGTIDIQTNQNLDAGGGTPILNNHSGGVIRKSVNSGIVSINVTVNNAAGATVEAQIGHFYLNGGGTVSGVYSILSGSQIRLGPAATTFTMSGTPTVTGAGTLSIVGATLDAGAGVDVTIPNLNLAFGTITGAGAVRVSGDFTFSAGTITGSGPRVLNSTSVPAFPCNLANCTLDGAALQLQTDGTYGGSSNAIVLSNGASLILDPGKILFVTNDGDFLNGGGAASSIVIGGFGSPGLNGCIQKTTTTGTSIIGVPVTLAGSFKVDAGTMQVAADVTAAAGSIVHYSVGTTLEITGGVFLFNSSSVSFPANGDFRVSAGTLRIPSSITLTMPNVTLQGSGVLDGGGTLILSGTSTWDSGAMGSAAAPGGITQINSGSTLNITAAGSQSLTQGRELRNSGTVNYSGSSTLTMSAAGIITNNAAFNLTSDGNINLSGSATIDNSGTLTKNGGTGTSTIFPLVNNAGTVSATSGTLVLAGGGTNSGTINVTSPGSLSLSSGTLSVSGGSIGGSGTLTFNGATATIGVPVNVGALNVTAGTATLNANGSADAFTMSGGTLGGSGTFTLNNGGTWSGGTMSGSGTTTNPATKTLGITAPVTLNNRTLQNDGTLSVSDNVTGSGTIANNGTLNAAGNITLAAAVNNSGQIATSSALSLSGGGTHSGSFNVTTPGTLSFSSGTHSMSGGGSIGGSGTLTFNGATATVGVPVNVGALNVTGGTATLNANGSADAFTMSGGTLGGSGTFTLNNGGTWSGGTMNGSGTTTNPATKTLGITAPVTINSRTLQNDGTLSVSDNVTGSGTIANNGTLNAAGNITLAAAVNNSGQLLTGALVSLGGGGTHSGTFNATTPSSVIAFSGGAHTISGAFTGPGKFRFSGAAATVNGAWSGSAIDVTGGSVALNTSGTIPALTLSGGTLAGSGNVTVSGPSTWSGGTIGGSGALTFDTGATVTMPGTSSTTLTRPLVNNGTINYAAASSAMLIDGVPITNSGTLDIQSSQSILVTPGTPPFVNNGTLKKSAGAGVMQFAAPLANSGLVQIGAGTLHFSGTYAQSAGTTDVQPGATLQTALFSLNGGSLVGNGTITGTVDNHAVVAPGASPGTLTISGDYVQASNGVLDIQIGGTAPGTQYDQLLISGNATLDGTLNVHIINGFVPVPGNMFQILTFGDRPNSTTFALIDGVDFGSGAMLIPTYSATDLQLIDANVQADLAASVSAPPSIANGSAFTYTVDIINQGGSNATSVGFNATLPPNVTFNSASPAICSGAPNLVCTVGALANQSAAEVVLNVTANGAGAAPLSVFAGGHEFDPNSANNTASASPSITAAADLRITVTGTSSTVAGSRAIYTITVTNNGPDIANNVAVSVTASPGLAFSANSGACAGSFPCAIGPLSSGQSATINSAWNISFLATGSVQLTVNAVSSTADPNGSNNSASATTFIGACPDIIITAPSELTSGASAEASVTATAAILSGATYSWSISHGTIDSGNGTDTITLTAGPPGATALAVNVTGGGCTLSTTVQITVKPKQTCQGTATPEMPAAGTITADAVVNFRWTTIDGASGYRLWLQRGDAPAESLGTTLDTSLTKVIPPGAYRWYVETLFDGCASHESDHLALTILPAKDCDSRGAPQLTAPANGAAATSASVAFSWDAVAKAIEYELWLAPAGGVPTLIRTTSGTSFATDVPPGRVEWYVRAHFEGCAATESVHRTFTYTLAAACTNQRPLLIAPAEGERLTSPVSFEWRSVPGATSYELYVDGVLAATTTSPNASGIALPLDERRWRVRARLAEGCGTLDSAESRFVVIAPSPSCTPLDAPVLTAPSQISSGVLARIQWTFVPGATAYVVQISTDPQFPRATTTSATVTERQLPFTFTNDGSAPAARYVRVYAIDTECVLPGTGPFSPVAVVSVLPRTGTNVVTLLTDPANVQYTLSIGAELAGLNFTAVSTVPWIDTVTPATGIVPPGGVTLHAVVHTAGLPPGTSTGSIVITSTAVASTARAALGVVPPPITVPVTVNNIPGLTTKPKNTPPPDALTIPAVANVTNFIARFQSDVYVTNTSAKPIEYEVNFTPTGLPGIKEGKTHHTPIEPGATVAVQDIVTTWFGGLTSSGTLEIRPLTESNTSTSSAPAKGLADRITFASSRTFAATPSGGTFGQFIPAVPYANFISTGAVISLQQIAQSDTFHTNLGLVEGSGEPVTVQVRIFDTAGAKQGDDFNVDLNGGQNTQINEVLKAHGIALDDGRIEVEVIKGEGKVTAYASVVGSDSNDPLFVPPVTIDQAGHSKWVVAGVADLTSDSSNWHTDVRIFNVGKDPVDLTLAFHSRNGTATTRTMTLAGGEVRQLDRVLSSFFAISQDGGALHVSSAEPVRLVVTARTYNETGKGAYGQFIPAVTPEEAVSAGSRPLQILQVEESPDYHSNVGFAEVSGNAVTLEVSVFLPDPKEPALKPLEVKLAPNEFRQIDSLLSTLGLAEAYNARISVRVIDGEGRATAYLSLINRKSGDPTYIPGQ